MTKSILSGLFAFALMFTLTATAGDGSVKCQLAMPSDGGSISTSTCTTSWPANSTVLAQCSADVRADIDNGTVTSADWYWDFTNNKDAVIVYQYKGQQHINVSLVSAASGQTCNFGSSPRAKPLR